MSNCKVDCILTDFQKINYNGKKIATKKIKTDTNIHKLKELPENICYNLWMHQVAYKTDIFKRIDYYQTEGISYTDQEWIFLPLSACKTWQYFPITLYYYLQGRADQTISTTIWEKNFWMEIKGMYVMLDERKKLYSDCSEEGKTFLDYRLKARALAIYDAQFRFKTNANIDAVKSLDLKFQNEFPYIIQWLDNRCWYVSSYRYIKSFRKNFTKNKFFACIHRVHYAMYLTKSKLFPNLGK